MQMQNSKRALKNAQSAFNDWNNTPATQRAEILERFADLLEKILMSLLLLQ